MRQSCCTLKRRPGAISLAVCAIGTGLCQLALGEVEARDPPLLDVERTQQLLEALCIEATQQQIAGAGTIQERTDFLQHLTDVVAAASGQTERPREAAAKDSHLLAVGAASGADLAAGDVNLFKRFPEVHAVIQASKEMQEDEKPLRKKLEEAHAALQETDALFETLKDEEGDVSAQELRDVCASLEHSIGAFVAGAAEFSAIYQREIQPWTASAAPLAANGLGPLAQDIDARYSNFRQVLKACGDLKASYMQLLERHEAAASKGSFVPQVLRDAPPLSKELADRAAALESLQKEGFSKKMLTTESL